MVLGQFFSIKSWFEDYIYLFRSDDPAFQQNIKLKKDHSYKVWENASDLAENLRLKPVDRLLSETAALLHDVGRFEQYRRYGTFSDRKSTDHGGLGVEVLKEKNVFQNLNQKEAGYICNAIYYHNKKEIPDHLDKKNQSFVKVLRDSDKLDIWRVVTDYYCSGNNNNALQLDLPDDPGINRQNVDDLMNERLVDLKNLYTLNDFKLLQIGWVYDLNFNRSYEILKEKRYLEKIFDSLPETDEIQQVRKKIDDYLRSLPEVNYVEK